SVPGGNPRWVACSRARRSADFRAPNVPKTFLFTGPCSRPSSPRRRVYITTRVAPRPFLLLSPFFRLGFRPRPCRLARPRCRGNLQRRLEREESGRPRLTEAVGGDLVEPLMGLVSQRVGCRRTRRRGQATLTGAHGDRLRTVPVWDL